MEQSEKLEKALNLLERAAERFDEVAPDKNWFREYFILTGAHMILTAEGWQSGEVKEELVKEAQENGEDVSDWILDEVNAPS